MAAMAIMPTVAAGGTSVGHVGMGHAAAPTITAPVIATARIAGAAAGEAPSAVVARRRTASATPSGPRPSGTGAPVSVRTPARSPAADDLSAATAPAIVAGEPWAVAIMRAPVMTEGETDQGQAYHGAIFAQWSRRSVIQDLHPVGGGPAAIGASGHVAPSPARLASENFDGGARRQCPDNGIGRRWAGENVRAADDHAGSRQCRPRKADTREECGQDDLYPYRHHLSAPRGATGASTHPRPCVMSCQTEHVSRKRKALLRRSRRRGAGPCRHFPYQACPNSRTPA